MIPELDTFDWAEVFKPEYATPTAILSGGRTEAPFTREDVAEVVAMSDGENDGEHWVGVFRLADGRWVSIEAGCDYTGWG